MIAANSSDYAALHAAAQGALREVGIPTAALDAEVLLCAAAGIDRSMLYARLREQVPDPLVVQFRAMLSRRLAREPVAYITGVKEFWSLPFVVSPEVLIPRPETELVVESAVALLRGGTQRTPLVCDLGTGSGCIAVAIARELPGARLIAADVSAAALRVARENVSRHGVADRIELVKADLFAGLDPTLRFDLVASNPPYVSDREALAAELLWEPRTALRAGADGLSVVARLIPEAISRMREGGWLVMELGSGQGEAACRLALEVGFSDVQVKCDLAGLPRVLLARRPRAAH